MVSIIFSITNSLNSQTFFNIVFILKLIKKNIIIDLLIGCIFTKDTLSFYRQYPQSIRLFFILTIICWNISYTS